MSLYLYLHIFTISFPLIRSFEGRINYASKWKYLFPAIAVTGVFFLVWDVLFTRNGVWGFNESYLIGISIFYLPIEEWLFFVTVPFASVFIYECILYFIKVDLFKGNSQKILWVFSIVLLILGIINFDKAYTFWNFTLTAAFICFSLLYLKPQHVDKLILAYLIHLVPFLLVNGVLTGAVTENPVVWYNNEQNLSLRVFTIPIEDTVYAFLLLFMNVSFYDFFKRKRYFKTLLNDG